MKQTAAASVMLGASSAVPLLTGVLTAKVWAISVGPTGYGHFVLLQAAVTLLMLISDFGVANVIVREASKALAAGEDQQKIWAAAALVAWPAAALTALACLLSAAWVAPWLLAAAATPLSIAVCILAFPFLTASNIRIGILTAHHRVRAVALHTTLSSIMAAVATGLLVFLLKEDAIPFVVIVVPFSRWVTAVVFVRRSVGIGLILPFHPEAASMAKTFVRLGAPLTLSMLIGPGITAVAPAIIAQQLGSAGVGFFQASNVFAMSLFGLLMAGMSQDFFPRISRIGRDSPEMEHAVGEQTMFMTLAANIAVIAAAAAAPWLLPAVFSHSFAPALAILPWHLLGIACQLAAAPLSFAMLAHLRGIFFILPALTTGISLVGGLFIFGRLYAEAGVGAALLASGAANFVCLQVLSKKGLGLRPKAKPIALLLLGGAVVGGMDALRRSGHANGATAALALGCAAALAMAAMLAKQMLPARPHKS